MNALTRFHYFLAILLVVGFACLTGVVVYYDGDIPDAIKEPFFLIVGAWITNFSVVVQYFFGSSKSSADKTQLLVSGKPQSGAVSLRAVAAIALALSMILGCSYLKQIYGVPEPVCDKPEYAESAICQIFRGHGLEPEQVHYPIVDASRIYVAVVPEDYGQVKEFIIKLRDFVSSNPWLYFSDLVAKTDQELIMYRAAAAIISDRLGILNVDRLIDQPSRELIIMSLDDVEAKIDELMAGR